MAKPIEPKILEDEIPKLEEEVRLEDGVEKHEPVPLDVCHIVIFIFIVTYNFSMY